MFFEFLLIIEMEVVWFFIYFKVIVEGYFVEGIVLLGRIYSIGWYWYKKNYDIIVVLW